MDLAPYIDTFVKGFCASRSSVHAYVSEQVNGLWVMRDAPGRKIPRRIEIVTSGLEPAEVAIGIHELGIEKHYLCEIHGLDADFESIRRKYKSLGYRALSTEGFFTHPLLDIPEVVSDPPVRKLEADSIPGSRRWINVLPSGSRTYAIWDEDSEVGLGWVKSIPVGSAAWASGLYVCESHRRLGFGRALMSKILQEDRALGSNTSVLLASSAGARLYPHLGYKQIGILQLFCPKKHL